MFTFLSLLFVLIVIFFLTSQKDHFKDVPPTHTVQIPTVPPATALLPGSNEKATPESVADVAPYTLPGEIPLAPYGQVATMSPLPYQDTTMIKANRQQILSLLEMLKGFLAFEAQQLTEKSDPSIQLPLSNARSDFQVLQNAVDLLNRNPGLQPTMTMTTLNEMSSNLAYLQEQVRLSGSAGSLQGPSNQFTEGFIPESIFIGLDGRFAEWAGSLIPLDKTIVLITAAGKEQESMIRLTRVGFEKVVGYLEGGFEAWKLAGKKIDMIINVEPEELRMDMQFDENMEIIDVRKPSEFDNGHIDVALNFSLAELENRLPELPAGNNLYVHCAGGYRSVIGASIMKKYGLHTVRNVLGGWAKITEVSDMPLALPSKAATLN
jgi:rhodanese-related sulfurtransferase